MNFVIYVSCLVLVGLTMPNPSHCQEKDTEGEIAEPNFDDVEFLPMPKRASSNGRLLGLLLYRGGGRGYYPEPETNEDDRSVIKRFFFKSCPRGYFKNPVTHRCYPSLNYLRGPGR